MLRVRRRSRAANSHSAWINFRGARQPYEASILDAVDFFIKFAKPAKGKVSIQEAMDSFDRDNKRRGLSLAYLTKSRTFFSQFRNAFKDCLMSDVAVRQAKEYIYGNEAWGAASKNSHIRHLRALYSATIKAGHATLNPFKDVSFVKEGQGGAGSKVLPVNDAEKLLDFALETGRIAECATLTLVLFCGVRMEETGRIAWEEITLDADKPRVRVEKAKNNQRRVNDIPDNAVHWLRACRGRGTVAPDNFTKAMQRLRQKARIPYMQNAARHSFASYHVALHDDAAKTAVLLGHPNPTLLYNTYRECVAREEAIRFFDVVPKPLREKRQAEKARREAEQSASKRRIRERLKLNGKAPRV